jgi:hypothetical protein
MRRERGRPPGANIPLLLIVLVLVALFLASACRGQGGDESDAQVTIDVSPEPALVGPAQVTARLLDGNGAPIRGARVEIEGTMNHAGMVPVIVEASEGEAGQYTTRGFKFTMGGDWIIIVRATMEDGRKLERTFDQRGVQGGKGNEQGGGGSGQKGGH